MMNGLWDEARLLRNSYPFIRYLKGNSSNMAIVDVEIPTGYIYTGYRFLDEFVSQQERYQVSRLFSFSVTYMYGSLFLTVHML